MLIFRPFLYIVTHHVGNQNLKEYRHAYEVRWSMICILCFPIVWFVNSQFCTATEMNYGLLVLIFKCPLFLQKVRLPEFEDEFFPQHWHLIQIIPFGSWFLAAPLRLRLFKEDPLFTD